VSALTLPEVRRGVRDALDRPDVAGWWASLPARDRAVVVVYGGWLPPELSRLAVVDVAELLDAGALDVAPALALTSTLPAAPLPVRRCARAPRRRSARISSTRAGADPPPSEKGTTPALTRRGWHSEHREATRVRFRRRRS
jgi:hypothetical protein